MIHYISQLKQYDATILASLKKEVAVTQINWFESYSDYQSGGWRIAALYNATGEEAYDTPLEEPIKPTPLLERMPQMQAFLEATGLDYFMVRLTQSLPNSYLYEHSDYEGLEKHEKLRLHIPLETQVAAQMSFVKANVYLESGYLWKLEPRSAVHGVYNRGERPRIHLVLDCYMNPLLHSLVETEWLDQRLVTTPPAMTVQDVDQVMVQARNLLVQGQAQAAEHYILTTFYDYQHLLGYTSYEMMINLYQTYAPEQQERIHYWCDRLQEVYHHST